MDRRYKKRMDRYWDKMKKHAIKCFESLDSTSWFDYWHCHIDWDGKGDNRPENRKASIKLGYEILQMADIFKSSVTGPVQTWWFIHEHSYEDAVYIHTPNKNNTPFPNDFSGIHWGETTLDYLNQVVNTEIYKVGTIHNGYGLTYVVTSK